jgi:hypothetical protein
MLLHHRHLENKALLIFGETLCMRWNCQNSNLKKELMDYLEGLFGVDKFNKKMVTSAVGEYLNIHGMFIDEPWQEILGMNILPQFQRGSGRRSLITQKRRF